MTQQLPQQVILTFEGEEDDFEVKAEVHIVGTEVATYKLGRVYDMDGEWRIEYGEDCVNSGVGEDASGPLAAVGQALDDALLDDSSDDDDEDEEGDGDKEGDEEDGDGVEHLEGREWILISRTGDSITRGMDTGNGCLVRVEIMGDDDGEFSGSVAFVPGTTVDKILNLEA